MDEIYEIYSIKLHKLFQYIEKKYNFKVSNIQIIPEHNGASYSCFVSKDIQDIDSYKWNRLRCGGDIFEMVCIYSPRYYQYNVETVDRRLSCRKIKRPYKPRSACKECTFTISQADRFLITLIFERIAGDKTELKDKDIAKVEINTKQITQDFFHKEALVDIIIKDVNIWE